MNELINFETITVTRYAAGTYVKGRFVRGASSSFSMSANVQTITGKELLQVPEGDRFKENKWVFSITELFDNDIITYEGKKFEVQAVQDWSKFCTEHYQSRITRIEKQ